jgi:hypothetical protein
MHSETRVLGLRTSGKVPGLVRGAKVPVPASQEERKCRRTQILDQRGDEEGQQAFYEKHAQIIPEP